MSFFKKKQKSIKEKKVVEKQIPVDIKEIDFLEIFKFCEEYTMTSVERMYALYNGVNYILANNIQGDFVECGVWKGGSAMLIAKLLLLHNIKNRKIILYDTYEGMSEPTAFDKDYSGRKAKSMLEESSIDNQSSVWCYSSYDEVRNNMLSTGLDASQIVLIKGKVEDTIPNQLPTNNIALLRLDTDWYESTAHELLHLYPLLNIPGILIIDDYGHWEGCRKAVDEYFKKNNIRLLLNRIDETGRFAIKLIV